MLITTSPHEKFPINIINFEQKTCIKNLSVYIDQHLNLAVLKATLYYTDIPLFKLCSLMWGNTYPSNLNKVCSLQNKCIRCMFFADSRESSQVFYKLLDILKFYDIV